MSRKHYKAFTRESKSKLEEYYVKTLQMVKDLGSPALVDGSVPFEVWKGIVQVIADASGYRVTFEAVMKQDTDDRNRFWVVGHHKVANSTLFHTPAFD
jgi:hypothetical protein